MWPIERMCRQQRVSAEDAGPYKIPFALVESGHRGLMIVAANARARRQGVWPGQALADARAALPGLKTRPVERERDAAALEKLAYWCGRYGPGRNIEGQDGIWVDVTGVGHLFGGEEGLLKDLTARLGRFGLTVRAGLADTPGGAFALARFGCDRAKRYAFAHAGLTEAALEQLPVESLRLDERSVLLLKRLGLRRIGQLYGLPRDALARRFRQPKGSRGQVTQGEALRAAGEVVLRLDQALGTRREARRPLCEPPVHMVRRSFPDPLISSEGIEAAAGQLMVELCAALEDLQEGVRRLRLTFYRADGTACEVAIGTSRPVRHPEHLLGLLREKFSMLDAGFGIDMMTMEAVIVDKFVEVQSELAAEPMMAPGVPGELVDRLSNRLGPGHVLRFRAMQSHIPELAWKLVPALQVVDRRDRGFQQSEDGSCESSSRRPLQRPSFLLERPEPIEVLATVPDGPPLRFTWRRVRHKVVKAEGPERIAPEWWRTIGRQRDEQRERTRDYYRIEDEAGARFWVFRSGLYSVGDEVREDSGGALPCWFMHGFFS